MEGPWPDVVVSPKELAPRLAAHVQRLSRPEEEGAAADAADAGTGTDALHGPPPRVNSWHPEPPPSAEAVHAGAAIAAEPFPGHALFQAQATPGISLAAYAARLECVAASGATRRRP